MTRTYTPQPDVWALPRGARINATKTYADHSRWVASRRR